MFAIHREEGPRGYAVYSDDGTLLADGLTQLRATRMLWGGGPEPKHPSRPSPIYVRVDGYQSGRLDAANSDSYYHNRARRSARWAPHWEGQY